MAITDIFKRKKAAPKAKPAEAQPPKAAVSEAAAEKPQREVPKGRPFDKAQGGRNIIGVISAPHLTEKTSAGSAHGWYAFRVRKNASKALIKRAVEDRYGVGVERVGILHKRPKKIRLGRIQGRSPGFKKAMVKVKEGQSIEFT